MRKLICRRELWYLGIVFFFGFKVATDAKQCQEKMFLLDISPRKARRRMFGDEIKKDLSAFVFVINPLYCMAAFISPATNKTNVILSFRFLWLLFAVASVYFRQTFFCLLHIIFLRLVTNKVCSFFWRKAMLSTRNRAKSRSYNGEVSREIENIKTKFSVLCYIYFSIRVSPFSENIVKNCIQNGGLVTNGNLNDRKERRVMSFGGLLKRFGLRRETEPTRKWKIYAGELVFLATYDGDIFCHRHAKPKTDLQIFLFDVLSGFSSLIILKVSFYRRFSVANI